VLPGVDFEEGSATGAMSFVNKSTKKWYLYIGSPAKAIKKRSNELLNLIDE
jgi:galactoside O-acetyltransferase